MLLCSFYYYFIFYTVCCGSHEVGIFTMTNTEFKTIRKSLKMTQAQFADLLGRSRRRIQSYEHGASKYRKNEIPIIIENFLKIIIKDKLIFGEYSNEI